MFSAPSPLDLSLAAELDLARQLLVAMGDDLAESAPIIADHGVALQTVDIVGQVLGHIANVVRATDRAGAVDRIGMGELRDRLAAAA